MLACKRGYLITTPLMNEQLFYKQDQLHFTNTGVLLKVLDLISYCTELDFCKIRVPTVAHKCHGKTFFLTAKLSFSRQNTLSHGKTLFLTAKHSFSRQNTLSHGKTLFLTAKLSFSRQNTLSHGKTLFLTAKLSFSK